ncbi:hypothetical protein [Streptomyces sp. NPDC055210]
MRPLHQAEQFGVYVPTGVVGAQAGIESGETEQVVSRVLVQPEGLGQCFGDPG